MGVPTVLAPTAELVEPRVRRFVERMVMPLFSLGGELRDFFLCESGVSQVEDAEGNQWFSASFGAEVLAHSFSAFDFAEADRLSSVINLGDVTVEPCGGRVLIKLWLYVRVMRY
jgi:hypothetical protein